MPDRPEKFVLAFAVRNAEGEVLLARRAAEAREYPGCWSIPTITVSRGLWRKTALDAEAGLRRFQSRFGVALGGSGQAISREKRDRGHYLLNMGLIAATSEAPLDGLLQKYVEYAFVRPAALTALFPDGGGLCVSMLVRHLIACGELGPNTAFVEVPPDLIGKAADEVSSEDLWLASADRYSSLRKGPGIKGGGAFKTYSVDRHFERRCRALADTVSLSIDLGCGDGAFVRWQRRIGLRAFGVDLRIPGRRQDEPFLIESPISTAGASLPARADLITLNLVAQWVADLDDLAQTIRQLASSSARVIVSVVPAEFSKNGEFVKGPEGWIWLSNKPLRQPPLLTMINHSVGPLRLYPRTIPEYVSLFGRNGLLCVASEYLYFDSLLSDDERAALLRDDPDLARHVNVPCFATMEFIIVEPPAPT